jgi:hypothetical protein
MRFSLYSCGHSRFILALAIVASRGQAFRVARASDREAWNDEKKRAQIFF